MEGEIISIKTVQELATLKSENKQLKKENQELKRKIEKGLIICECRKNGKVFEFPIETKHCK